MENNDYDNDSSQGRQLYNLSLHFLPLSVPGPPSRDLESPHLPSLCPLQMSSAPPLSPPANTWPLALLYTFLPQHSGPFPEAPAQPFCLKSQLLNTSICFVSFISGSLICLGWSVFHFKGIFQHLLSPGRPLTLMVSPGRAGGSGEGAC